MVRGLLGPFFVLFSIGLVELLAEFKWGTNIAAPLMLIVLVVVTFSSSFRSALAASVLAWLYAAFLLPQHLAPLSSGELQVRAVVWLFLMLGITILISFLRRRSETKLKTSEARTRSILESAHDAFIGMNGEGRVTGWNRQAEKMFGWKREEVLNKLLSEVLIPLRYRDAHQRGLERFLKTGEGPVLNKRIELSALHRLGHELPIELTIYPIRDQQEILFGSFLRDITDEKRETRIQAAQLEATEVLTKSLSLEEACVEVLRALYQGMKRQMGELWIESIEKGHLRRMGFWSEYPDLTRAYEKEFASARLLGGQGVLGRVWRSGEFFAIPDLTLYQGSFEKRETLLEAGIRRVWVFPLVVEGSHVLGALSFYQSSPGDLDERSTVFLNEVANYLALFIQRKRAEAKLAQLYQDLEIKVEERTRDLAVAYEQAQNANRLKDEFLATVSHELRTPLGVIMGHSDLMLEGGMSEEQKQISIETIHRNAQIQMRIISDLLDVSRIITGKMQLDLGAVNVLTLIQDAVESIRIAADAKDIALVMDLEKELGPVRGDANRLQQVLWNLLSNAVKFTPKGGRVEVRLRREGSKAQIQVVDSGKGVEPGFLPHVFERFRQEDASTTRKYGGLGLGLAIVKHLTEAHGGAVEAMSEGLGRGATFQVSLPLMALRFMDRSPTGKDFLSSDVKDKPLRNLKILIVEDESDTREMLGLVLKRAGADVRLAASANEGLRLFNASLPQVLISDISMPGQDGFDLISEIRSRPESAGGRVPAIALTAHARQDEKERALSTGFDLHLSKPVEASELVKHIRHVING